MSKEKKKKDVIIIDKSKFSKKDMEKLEEYRVLAFWVYIFYRYCYDGYLAAKTNKEKRTWMKCFGLLDEIRSKFEDEMFKVLPNLPDSAVKIFYNEMI